MILVISPDNEFPSFLALHASVTKRILECEGIVAHCVASGEEALEQIKEKTFSLMITDEKDR